MFSKQLSIVAVLALGAVAQDSSSASTPATSYASSATATGTGTAAQGGSESGGLPTISALVAEGLEASVVAADNCETTLAINCGGFGTGAMYCSTAMSYGLSTITLTAQPTAIQANFGLSTAGETGSFSFRCDYQGPSPSFTAEVCTVSVSASAQGRATSTSRVSTISSSVTPNPVEITAGATKLPSGSATCTNSHGVAAPTAGVEVYRVLVPVGAAIAAGAAFL